MSNVIVFNQSPQRDSASTANPASIARWPVPPSCAAAIWAMSEIEASTRPCLYSSSSAAISFAISARKP